MSTSTPAPGATSRVSMPVAAALDAVLILVFAAVGRASHSEDNPVLGAFGTAVPFLLGAAVGWGLVRRRSGRWPTSFGTGIPVWFCTLVVGMLLRALTGAGTAASFILIAGLILAAFLLGWRFVAERLTRRAT